MHANPRHVRHNKGPKPPGSQNGTWKRIGSKVWSDACNNDRVVLVVSGGARMGGLKRFRTSLCAEAENLRF